MAATHIVVKFELEGMHYWPGAEEFEPTVGFLKYPHRHIFHITAKKRVDHDNRDIEIILFKREISEHFKRTHWNTNLQMIDFRSMSCEMIARELMEVYDLHYVQVLEDNENGAEIF